SLHAASLDEVDDHRQRIARLDRPVRSGCSPSGDHFEILRRIDPAGIVLILRRVVVKRSGVGVQMEQHPVMRIPQILDDSRATIGRPHAHVVADLHTFSPATQNSNCFPGPCYDSKGFTVGRSRPGSSDASTPYIAKAATRARPWRPRWR